MRFALPLAACVALVACSHDFGFLDAVPSGDGGATDADAASESDSSIGDQDASPGDASDDTSMPIDGGPPMDAALDHVVPPRDSAADTAPPDSGNGVYAVCAGSVKGCDPLTNDGCNASSHCTWANNGVYTCSVDNGNKVWPAACADFTECAAGFDCFPGKTAQQQCERYCCNDGDCPANTTCHPWDVAGTCY